VQILLTAVATFAATNIDDFALLVGWFADCTHRSRHIALGQLLGISTLTIASIAIAVLVLPVPNRISGLLGILPIAIGLYRILRRPSDAEDQGVASAAGSVLTVASVTFAHGSDNIAVYVPLFAIQTPIGIALIFVVFLLMTGVWLVLTHWFVRHPKGGPAIQRWGHRIVPWVLILLGVNILVSAGTITWLLSLLPLVQ
jgi:cadmium resistance protein CadD (predicted permease)